MASTNDQSLNLMYGDDDDVTLIETLVEAERVLLGAELDDIPHLHFDERNLQTSVANPSYATNIVNVPSDSSTSMEAMTPDTQCIVDYDSDEDVPLAFLRRSYCSNKLKPSEDNDDITSQMSPVSLDKETTNDENPETVFGAQETGDGNHIQARKRMRNPSKWKANIRKEKRNRGEAYTTRRGKSVEAREMRAGCGDTCKRKCHQKIEACRRTELFNFYWSLGDIERQRQYLVCNVKSSPKGTHQVTGPSRRSNSVTYIFPNGADNGAVVCQKFFLDTLGISEKAVRTALNKVSPEGLPMLDNRGVHANRGNGIDDEKDRIKGHIESFPKTESHYCRKETQRQYLGSNLNLEKLYYLYKEMREKENGTPASITTYKNIFYRNYNLGFHHRSKDKCDQCSAFYKGDTSEQHEKKADHERHRALVENSRRYKDWVKEQMRVHPEIGGIVFDLQEVLNTPKTNEGIVYYKRKLNNFNLSVYELQTGEAHNFLWNETIVARGANEIGSCVYKFLTKYHESGKTKVYLFSDCCGGQNRNKHFFSMLWYAVQKLHFTYVEHVFFVSGHSFNEGDSVHSRIEQASAPVDVYTTQQWAAIIRLAKRSRPYYQVHELQTEDFFDFKAISGKLFNFEVDTNGEKVSWLQLKRLCLASDQPSIITYSYDYNFENKMTWDLTKKLRKVYPLPTFTDISLQPAYSKLLNISPDKKEDLMELCRRGIIPKAHHAFYESLPCDERV